MANILVFIDLLPSDAESADRPAPAAPVALDKTQPPLASTQPPLAPGKTVAPLEVPQTRATAGSLAALAAARRVASQLGATVYAVVPCVAPPSYGDDDIIAVLSRHGADKVVLATSPLLSPPALYATHAEALFAACDRFPPQLVLFDEDAGRELGPRVAFKLQARYSEAQLVENGEGYVFEHAVFRRRLSRTEALMRPNRPLVLSLTNSGTKPPAKLGADEAEVVVVQAPTESAVPLSVRAVDDDDDEQTPALTRAPLVLAGGVELGEQGFARLAKLGEKLDAPVVGSPAAVSAGLWPTSMRVGLDGHCVDAQVYVAFAVSGSERHLAALGPNTRIVAINTDAEAPIFRCADVGLVADAISVIDELLAAPVSSPALATDGDQ